MEEEKRRKWYYLDANGITALLVICAGILFYLCLTHLQQVMTFLNGLGDILAPFAGGFVIAFLLNTPINFMERTVYRNVKGKHALSIITVYLIAVCVIVFLLLMVVPQVLSSASSLAGNITSYMNELDGMLRELLTQLGQNPNLTEVTNEIYLHLKQNTTNLVDLVKSALNALPELVNLGMAVGNGVISMFTSLIASIYMLSDKDKLIRQMKKVIYAFLPLKGADRIMKLGRLSNTIFVRFLNGKILDSLIIGVLCFVLTSAFRIPYASLIGTVVGVTNIIPFFGPIIGAVPCLLILVIIDPWKAILFAVLILALQQFDGNILGPKILGNSTGLSPLWVLFSIMVGSGLFGFKGMLLGVPTFAVFCAVLRDLANERLEKKKIKLSGKTVETESEKKDPASADIS